MGKKVKKVEKETRPVEEEKVVEVGVKKGKEKEVKEEGKVKLGGKGEEKKRGEEELQVKERGAGKGLPGHILVSGPSGSRGAWYVVHTSSGHEARVAENLRQRAETLRLTGEILEILLPTQDKIQVKSGRKEKIKEKIFPGYLLVKMVLTDESWLAVRTTPGITGFVGTVSQPTPLSEKEVLGIMKFISSPAPKYKTKFSKDEAVRIIDGPFTDFLGTIDNVDETTGKLRVLVSIFGRETPVELDSLQVTKI